MKPRGSFGERVAAGCCLNASCGRPSGCVDEKHPGLHYFTRDLFVFGRRQRPSVASLSIGRTAVGLQDLKSWPSMLHNSSVFGLLDEAPLQYNTCVPRWEPLDDMRTSAVNQRGTKGFLAGPCCLTLSCTRFKTVPYWATIAVSADPPAHSNPAP